MNAFALLGFEPRPWLDPAAVQSPLTGKIGPGKVDKMSEAKKILANPRLRLQHLLELTCPGKAVRGGPTFLPAPLAGWFSAATKLEERMNALLERKNAVSSPLGRALLAREAMPLHEEAEAWLGRLAAHEAEWTAALQEWDARWEANEPTARSCEVLATFAHAFAYLERWREAVRNRAFALLEP